MTNWMIRMIDFLTPWPSRADRKRNVAAARAAARDAHGKAVEAEKLTRELSEIIGRNHFAQTIIDGLTGQRGPDGRRQ